ncbi:MarR family transcriptional regulator [Tamaricihabitans halophyticus]|uniref:MarR family transcriptional regulator n=1 Tax=Tamaricihabitans halophyticus TaxID=1262583 RepID=A0A4R2R359_9PSEU|nr:MarR family winged helix-turn-helix transcriptional regulator [Tamaricihabitans halophyticus]TCP57232.1 MarR family transcriptional regulator [Tamaricihabitans halophyticus]
MRPSYESCVELFRQLRLAAQLQHAWFAQWWQGESELHPATISLLGELHRCGECRPSELANRRMVDLSVISRQLGQLIDAGLVERRPAPEDGRAALVRASAAGEQALMRWKELHAELLQHALADWDDERVTELIGELGAVNKDLRAAVDAGRSPVTAGVDGGQ